MTRGSCPLLATIALCALVLVGCSDPAEELSRYHEAVLAGDDGGAQELLAGALEKHPHDTELLLAAAEFYLRPDAPDFYKPRLSLHYAMRADRSANYTEPRATRAMVRAHRGAGGFAETDALVREGLAGVAHPDADEPVAIRPVDPDLLDVTLPNILEQKRRWEEGRLEPTCEPPLVLVPAGRWEVDGDEVEVEAFCVEETARPAPIRCATLELRECAGPEGAVVDGPFAGLLKGPPEGARCCADPIVKRVQRDASPIPTQTPP